MKKKLEEHVTPVLNEKQTKLKILMPASATACFLQVVQTYKGAPVHSVQVIGLRLGVEARRPPSHLRTQRCDFAALHVEEYATCGTKYVGRGR